LYSGEVKPDIIKVLREVIINLKVKINEERGFTEEITEQPYFFDMAVRDFENAFSLKSL